MQVNTGPTIDSRYIHCLLRDAQEAGLDLEPLLRKSGVCRSDLETLGKRLPVEKAARLVNYCQSVTRDEGYCKLDRPVDLGNFRLAALSLVHLRTLGRALQRLTEYINVRQNSIRLELHMTEKSAKVAMTQLPEQKPADCSITDFYLTVVHRFIGWLGGYCIPLDQVTLSFPPPDYRAEHRYLYYGAPVLYNQSKTSMNFTADYLDNPIIQSEGSVENYIRRAPLDVFLPQVLSGELTIAVRKQVHVSLTKDGNIPTMEHLASLLDFAPQTLRRRLRDERACYHDIKLQVRRDIAVNCLSHDHISIESIAEKVGYTEASAFTRAFKNWTGLSPLEFRKALEST
jgi:AraC-like DNA-binding protein